MYISYGCARVKMKSRGYYQTSNAQIAWVLGPSVTDHICTSVQCKKGSRFDVYIGLVIDAWPTFKCTSYLDACRIKKSDWICLAQRQWDVNSKVGNTSKTSPTKTSGFSLQMTSEFYLHILFLINSFYVLIPTRLFWINVRMKPKKHKRNTQASNISFLQEEQRRNATSITIHLPYSEGLSGCKPLINLRAVPGYMGWVCLGLVERCDIL